MLMPPPTSSVHAPRFGLGAAQLGMTYGRFNQVGQPDLVEANLILRRAKALGLSMIDTASQYGSSELVLGACYDTWAGMQLFTKTPSFGCERILPQHAAQLRQAFELSLRRLSVKRVNGLLMHHAPDLLLPGASYLFDQMLNLKESGLVERIGISVYSSDIADQILQKFPIDLIQVPINVFDQRLLDSGSLNLWSQSGIEVHARSAFLQGLLLTDPGHLADQFLSIEPTLSRFQKACNEQGVNRTSAALHFLLQLKSISKILIGVETAAQLAYIFLNFPEQIEMDWAAYRIEQTEILNPALWKDR